MLISLMTLISDSSADRSAEASESLDAELKSLLSEIEAEESPERLLELARELRRLLALRRAN